MDRDTSLLDIHGQRLSERDIKRGLQLGIFASSLGVIWWALAQGMPLQMFMEALGSSGFVIGLVTTVMQAALVIQIPAAFLADRVTARKRIWGPVMIASRVLYFVPPLLLLFMPENRAGIAWSMIALIAVSSFLGQSVTAFWFTWMADLVPGRMRGRFWGGRQSWTMMAYLLAMGLAGYLLDAFPHPGQGGHSWIGFLLVFLIGAVFGCLDIIIYLGVPEPQVQSKEERLDWLGRLMEPFRAPDFRYLTVSLGIFTFALGLASLGLVYLKKDFHVTYSHLAAMTVASSMGALALGFVWGYVVDRLGGRALGAILLVIAPISSIAWFFVKDYSTDFVGFFRGIPVLETGVVTLVGLLPDSWGAWLRQAILPQSVWIFVPLSFLGGALYSGINICQLSLNSSLLPKKGRTMAMAVHWASVGLIGALGSAIGGEVMDFFAAHPMAWVLPTGTRMAFQQALIAAFLLVTWLVALPVFLKISRRRDELPIAVAFSRLFMANPIRAVTNIYAIGRPISGRRRARAVRKLGERRTSIAVSDLIGKLDDASTEVREASVFALGSIGSAEAVDALVKKLDDPNSDLSSQIARALRMAKDPRSVEALMRRLKDGDRETRSESARTLGEIGDRRAVPSLLGLLAESKDSKIISSSSEALARLGEVAAIYEMIPRMKASRNPVLKRSLAVAIGDLLGEPEGFYRVLISEEASRGSEVERMLEDISRGIRHVTRKDMRVQGTKLTQKAREIQFLYEENDFPACQETLFGLAVGLAALVWGVRFGGDSKAFIEDLIWRDQRFGVGVWFLDFMRQRTGTPEGPHLDNVDILLGTYFLACHAVSEEITEQSRNAEEKRE